MIIFVYGEDAYRSSVYVKNLLFEYKKKYPQHLDVLSVDLEESNFDIVMGMLRVGSLFDSRKFLTLKNVFSSKIDSEALNYFLENGSFKADRERIILVHESQTASQLKKKNEKLFAYLESGSKPKKEFNYLKTPALKTWIQNYFLNEKLSIKQDALLKLTNIGPDLFKLSYELEKIATYAKFSNLKSVSSAEVLFLVESPKELDSFALGDAVLAGNAPSALVLFDRYLKEEGEFPKLIGLLSFQARSYLMIHQLLKDGLNLQGISKKTGIHPFVVKKVSALYGQKAFLRMSFLLDFLPRLEYKLKNGENIRNGFLQFFNRF